MTHAASYYFVELQSGRLITHTAFKCLGPRKLSWLFCFVQDDGLQKEDMDILLDAFPEQPLDFFGALRYGRTLGRLELYVLRTVL